jgi:hypothetical protein
MFAFVWLLFVIVFVLVSFVLVMPLFGMFVVLMLAVLALMWLDLFRVFDRGLRLLPYQNLVAAELKGSVHLKRPFL